LLLPVVLGSVTGLLVGGLATVFRFILEALDVRRGALFDSLSPTPVLGWLAPMLIVGLAVLLAAELVRRFAPEAAGSGIQEIEGALGGLRSLRWQRVLPVKFFGALLSLGSGAVLGREGPTVQMGGCVGAMVSERLGLAGDRPAILIAAGAAAGLSAAFNAPLAGILFVFEEMRRYFPSRFASRAVVAVAAVCAAIVARLSSGQTPVITMPAFPAPPIAALWLFVLFGVLFGVLGVAFNRSLLGVLDVVERLPALARRLAPFVIGAGLGLVAFVMPDAIGGGYSAIDDALAGRIAGGLLLTLFVIRFATTILSYSTGAPGGIFMPMLALGTLVGLAFGTGVQELVPVLVPDRGVFAVAGMAAFFAATVRSPLTGIALAVEMTGDFEQILPLIVSCIAAAVAAEGLGGRPIYAQLLERTLRRAGLQTNA